MADGAVLAEGAGRGFGAVSWPTLLAEYTGTTVTIFTSSGGQSGAGFTGVLLAVNPVFVRLITRIGPPPGCALGNACTGFAVGAGGYGFGGGFGYASAGPAGVPGAVTAGGWDAMPVWTVGSVTDIPIAAIVSFVHHAI